MLSLKNAMIQTAALSWRILILMHLFMQDVNAGLQMGWPR